MVGHCVVTVPYRPSSGFSGLILVVRQRVFGKSTCVISGWAQLTPWPGNLASAEGGTPRLRRRRPPGLGLTLAASPKCQEVLKEHVSTCSGSSFQDASLVYRHYCPCARLQRGLVSRKSSWSYSSCVVPARAWMTKNLLSLVLPFQAPPSLSFASLSLVLSKYTQRPSGLMGYRLSSYKIISSRRYKALW